MRDLGLRRSRQIRYGARDFQDPVMGARRPLETLGGRLQQHATVVIELAHTIDLASIQSLIAAILPCELARAGMCHAFGNVGARFGRRDAWLCEFVGRQGG